MQNSYNSVSKTDRKISHERGDFNKYSESIYNFFSRNSRMPSYAEVCKLCAIKSKNTAHNLIKKLQAQGYLKIDRTGKIIPLMTPTHTETIFSIKSSKKALPKTKSPMEFSKNLTLLGLVEAGFPTPSEESLRESISLDDWIIDKKEASFMLKVKGDSMQDAGILDGDMVIVERNVSPKIGQIVIAEVDGSYTMKYLKKTPSGQMYLEPANKNFKPIFPKEDLRINAVVKAVVRKYGR